MDRNFTIVETTRDRLPRLPFLNIKNKILGKKFVVSLVFIGEKRSRALNKKYRRKNKPANILTFPFRVNPHTHKGVVLVDSRFAKRTTIHPLPYGHDSMSVGVNEGEIFMCLKQIKKDSKRFWGLPLSDKKSAYVKLCTFVFIHGLLHLKGLAHGSKIEEEEEKYLHRFNFK